MELSPGTHRYTVRQAVSAEWQSAAAIAQRCELQIHRASELLLHLYRDDLVQRQRIYNPRGISYEYRLIPVVLASGYIAGKPYWRGLTNWA